MRREMRELAEHQAAGIEEDRVAARVLADGSGHEDGQRRRDDERGERPVAEVQRNRRWPLVRGGRPTARRARPGSATAAPCELGIARAPPAGALMARGA